MNTAWLRVAIIAGCGIYSTAASANCAVVALGGGMSLLTCSGGTRGTMTDLGKGLTFYRLSNGSSGIVNLRTSSTSANGSGTTTSTSGTSNSGTGTTSLAVPAGGTIFYLVNGTTNSVSAAAVKGSSDGVTSIVPPLDTPLTPAMTNLAMSGIAVPMSSKPVTGPVPVQALSGKSTP